MSMLAFAPVLPGALGSTCVRNPGTAPPHDPRFLCIELRLREPAFNKMGRGPWAVFRALLDFFGDNVEAWPTQDSLATCTGFCVRAVREFIDKLVAAGFITVRRARQIGGTERLFYRFGPASERAFDSFVARFPRERREARAKPLHSAPSPSLSPAQTPAAIPATIAAAAPAQPADKHDQRSLKPSSSEGAKPTPNRESSAPTFTRDEEEFLERVGDAEKALANEALAYLARRRQPKRPVPRWFDRPRVELVALRASQVDGADTERLATLKHAVDGAWLVSQDAPSTAFIFGSQEHFLEHVERGIQKARGDARAALRRGEADRGAPPLPALVQSPPRPRHVAGMGIPSEAEHKPDRGVSTEHRGASSTARAEHDRADALAIEASMAIARASWERLEREWAAEESHPAGSCDLDRAASCDFEGMRRARAEVLAELEALKAKSLRGESEASAPVGERRRGLD